MTVYVDEITLYPRKNINPVARRWGMKWCHLFGDDEEELHLFARSLGLKRSYYQEHRVLPHYDLVTSKRYLALLYGAKEKSSLDFLRERRASSLGEKDGI